MNTQTIARERVSAREAPAPNLPAIADQHFAPAPAMPRLFPPKIAKALLAIQREFGAVKKAGWNDFHKYNYQKWEDVLNRISILLAEHELIISQSEVSRSLFENDQLMSISYDFTIINGDGDVWPERPVWTAIARVRDSKGTTDDKAANKCHTQAHKYFLVHQFKIRTAETAADDSDGDAPAKPAAPKPPNPNAAPAPSGPRLLPIDGQTPQAWTERLWNEIKQTSKTDSDVVAWRDANKIPLRKLEDEFPELASNFFKSIGELMGQLSKPAAPKPPNPNGGAPKPPNPNAQPEDDGIPENLRRQPKPTLKDQLLTTIGQLDNKADAMRFADDKDVYEKKKQLPEADRVAVESAYGNKFRELVSR